MGKDAPSLPAELKSELGRIARQLGREIYPGGLPRDTKFSELECVAGVLGDEIARQIIETQVEEQAGGFEEELGECPECHGPARKAPDQPRVLVTTRGEVRWNERVANCPRCRRAFFPSESSVRH
jgi:uncharacterized protein with PIN domain